MRRTKVNWANIFILLLHCFFSPLLPLLLQVVSCMPSVEPCLVSAVWWHWWWLRWIDTWWSPGLWPPSGRCPARKPWASWLLPGSTLWAGACHPSLAGVSTTRLRDLDAESLLISEIPLRDLVSWALSLYFSLSVLLLPVCQIHAEGCTSMANRSDFANMPILYEISFNTKD